MRRALFGALILAVLVGGLAPRTARAASDYGSDSGWGIAAIVANLVYAPAKMTYAVMGGITGGFAYVLTIGNMEAVDRIWSPSLGGTWVLTPGMLRGDEDIYFSGESYD
jgi:hypothetical protein